MTGPVSDNGYGNPALRRVEQEYEKRITQAFSSGYSVVEISRTIGGKRALPVYRILQKRGLIGTSLKRTRFKGPTEMQGALLRMGMSFTQWCNSWGFDPRMAVDELSGIVTDSTSGIRLAACRDFPNLYAKRNSSLDLEEWEKEISSTTTGYSYRIDWDQRLERYLGRIQGVETLKVIGKHPSVVMMELVRATWLLKAIDRLDGIEKSFPQAKKVSKTATPQLDNYR